MYPRIARSRIALVAAVLLAPSFASAQGGHGPGPGRGHGGDMAAIHELMAGHEGIERRVTDVPGGVETVTESQDPFLAQTIRTHVRQMEARLAEGRPIRRWDPLFDEIFLHAAAIDMRIEDTERGVRVIETSDDPRVTMLIRQHARRAVSEFVARGMERMHEATPLPQGYDSQAR